MAQPPETFEQFLERTLANGGLRSYGHNTARDEAAEDMCYQRALKCFNLTAPPWWSIHSAPLGDESPPWGIHSPEGEEVRHAPPLGEHRNDGTGCYFDGTPRTGNRQLRRAEGEKTAGWSKVSLPEGASLADRRLAAADEEWCRINPKGAACNIFPPWGKTPHIPATAEPVHNDVSMSMSYSFDGAARGLIEHHLSRIRLHLTQIGHVLDANLDK